MQRQDFNDRITQQAAFASPNDAEAAVRAVMNVLGETLLHSETQRIRGELPEWLADLLSSEIHDEPLDADSFFERVAARESVAAGFAREHVGVILRAVASALPAAAQGWLRAALPEDLRSTLDPRDATAAPAKPHHGEAQHTLATGKPGSGHPVNESSADRTQHHSVATSESPHDDSKVSTSSGLTQEQVGESLATGHPGSDRPLSDSED